MGSLDGLLIAFSNTGGNVIQVSRKAFKRVVKPDEQSEREGVYCLASVDVWVPIGPDGTKLLQVLRSGGLYDIDVASEDDPYLDEVYAQEVEILETVLTAFGIAIID